MSTKPTTRRPLLEETQILGFQGQHGWPLWPLLFLKVQKRSQFLVGEAGKVDAVRFLHTEAIEAVIVKSPAKRMFPTLGWHVEVTHIRKGFLKPTPSSGVLCLIGPWDA